MAGYNNDLDYTLSQYAILTGGANNTLNNVLPGVSGTVLTSNGVSAQPSFQSAPSGNFSWNSTSASSQSCLVNNGYATTGSSQQNMYLPGTAAIGGEIKLSNIGSGYVIQPPYGQTVNLLSQTATYPSNLQTTTANAAADLVCTNANTSWTVVNNEGSYTQGIVTSALSGSFSFADFVYIKANGTAWGCGQNAQGELGNQTVTSYSSPIATVAGQSYIQISIANNTTIALRGDGTAWSWGYNGQGQIGNNSTTSYSSPVSVVGGFSFIQIQTAGNATVPNGFSAGLTSLGTLWMWGTNGDGNLGTLNHTSYSSPVSVVGNHSFVQFSLGPTYAYGLKATGDIWSWGFNSAGQLGTQTTTSYSSPVSVVGNHSFIQVAAGKTYFLALKIDGSCWGCGLNSAGQIGTQSTTASYSSPVSVVGGHSFIQIACGGFGTSYGLKANGQIWSWGMNPSGQIGNNTTTSYSSPVSVVGGFAFANLVTCSQDTEGQSMGAWLTNGQIWSWGLNNYGQLGNNTTTSYSSPVLILNTP